MKKLMLVAAVAAAISLMAGCASMTKVGATGLTSQSVTMAKTGQDSSKVWLGVFGAQSYPTVESVAKKAGITKVATVEYQSQLGIIGLWTTYTTIVTGE